MHTTKVFSDLLRAYVDPAVRVILLQGSTRSSKTWSALQLVNTIASRSKAPRLVSVVSESLPHLKAGAIRDFEKMLTEDGLWRDNQWHDTNKKYSYTKGALEFFSASDLGRVTGPSREVLYVNEGINIEWKVYQQLAARTTEKIIVDFNPAFEFWGHTNLLQNPDYPPGAVVLLKSTYKDNDMLSAAQIMDIESNRNIDPEWWKVYGEGEIGTGQGLVWQNWDIVDAMPARELWEQAVIVIDFGWTAPSAVELMVKVNGEIFIDELAYGPNMDNRTIAKVITDAGYGAQQPGVVDVVCDSAEPKSIEELQFNGVKATKTKSKEIELGLQIAKRYKKHYTARSLGTITENRMYRYPLLADGVTYGTVPIKKHGHAKDAERYGFLSRFADTAPGYAVTYTKGRK